MRRLTPGVMALIALAGGALSVLPLWALPAAPARTLAALLHVAALAAGTALIARTGRVDGAARRARLLVAAAGTAATAGGVVTLLHLVVAGTVPKVSPATAVTLLAAPLLVYGLLVVPSYEGAWPIRRVVADGALAAAALLPIGWILVLRPVSEAPGLSTLERASLMSHPVSVIIVAATIPAVIPRVRRDTRRLVDCLAAGLGLLAVGSTFDVLQLAQHGTTSFGWPDVVQQAGLGLIIYGALPPARAAAREVHRPAGREELLPYGLVILALVIVADHVATGNPLELGDTVAIAVMVLVLMLRQVVLSEDLRASIEQQRGGAVQDPLTGLANRTAFLGELTELLAAPGHPRAAVLLSDLNGFKEVNDTLGHDWGDRVLKDFARQLRTAAGDHLVARLGGDEFAVLVVTEDPEPAARKIAERIERDDTSPAEGLRVACSVGIAGTRDGDDGPGDVLRRADLAMYSAKRSRQPTVAVFEESMVALSERRNLLVAQLPGAVERGEMHLVYQPLFGLVDDRLAGAETLVRWTHPLLGRVPPEEFIPLAEESGDIAAIGRWVLDTALAQMTAWQDGGRLMPHLYVNVAAAQFTDGFPAHVAAALLRHRLSPERLTLEVTESQVPLLTANRAMQRLRHLGVRIALDDFGSGYSSLAQLASLPVDILKIDRDFIVNLDATSGPPILEAVVTLAKALGLTTVAEGVENGGQAADALAAGVDYVQGYLYCRPAPGERLFAELDEGPVRSRVSSPGP